MPSAVGPFIPASNVVSSHSDIQSLESRSATFASPGRSEGSGYLDPSSVSANHGDTQNLENMMSSPTRHSPGGYSHKAYIKSSGVQAVHEACKALERRVDQITEVRDIRMPVDLSCGHCFPPTVPCSGSTDVWTDQFCQVRVSDCYICHCCGIACHCRVASQGSRTTYADQLPKHCHTHAISCGDFACNGSYDAWTGY